MNRDKKNRLMKEAAEISRDNCGYIHAEIVNGQSEQIISGDIHAVIYGVMAIVRRLSELSGQSFKDTLTAVAVVGALGSYEEYINALGVEKKEYETIEGEDWQEEWEKQTRLELEKAANIENAKLKVDLAKSEKLAKSLEDQLKMVKQNAEKAQQKADKRIRELTKECQALEARMKEMENAIIVR